MSFLTTTLLLIFTFSAQAQDSIQFDGMTLIKNDGKTIISDSLVKDLDCSTLTAENVFMSLQPNAFSADKHMPVKNWSANLLGQCWALSLTQREYFYLVRFGAANGAPSTSDIDYLLQLSRRPGTRKVVGISDTCFLCSSSSSATFKQLWAKDFKSNIETKQKRRFYDPANIGKITGERERSKEKDQETMNSILSELAKGRMPLLVLRAAVDAQHVVLVKNAKAKGTDGYVMEIYDSNYPSSNNVLEFSGGRFYGPRIFGNIVRDAASPIGVFLDDISSMDKIQNAAFAHYSQACKATGK